MNISGYLVFWNNDSMTSNWARVNVVRSLLCFLGFPGAYGDTKNRGKYTFKYCKMTFRSFRKCKIQHILLRTVMSALHFCGAVLVLFIFSESDFFSIYTIVTELPIRKLHERFKCRFS